MATDNAIDMGFEFVPKEEKADFFKSCSELDGGASCSCGCGQMADGFAVKEPNWSLLVREQCMTTEAFATYIRRNGYGRS